MNNHCDDQSLPQATARQVKRGSADQSRVSRAFGRLPHIIRNDERLTATDLIVLAYRSTFVGKFKLRAELLHRLVDNKPTHSSANAGESRLPRNGLGRNAAYRSIRRLVQLGYLKRSGDNSRIIEELGYTSSASTPHIKRAWFDGTLSLNALATFIWLKVNPGAFARELAQRFGWDRKTAQQALQELAAKKWVVARRQERNANGRYAAWRYQALSEEDRAKLTGSDLAVRERGARILRESPSRTTKVNPSNKLQKPRLSDGSESPSVDDLVLEAYEDPRLLGWISGAGNEYYQTVVDEIGSEERELVASLVDPQKLLELIRLASGRRISPAIAGPLLAAGVVELAAGVLVQGNNNITEPAAALRAVLEDIQKRIGRTGDWLNSLELIGKRLLLAWEPCL